VKISVRKTPPTFEDDARAETRCPDDYDGLHNWQNATTHSDTNCRYICINCLAAPPTR